MKKNKIYKNIFNEKLLNREINKFDFKEIKEKYATIEQWEKLIESGNLEKNTEKNIQGEFLISIFNTILGYDIKLNNPKIWNLMLEEKVKKDSTVSDGALGFYTGDSRDTRVVIELKDAKTDLDKKQERKEHLTPVEQAFNYSNKNGSKCKWVIVSNFKEIRLYNSSSSIEYEKFEINKLSDEYELKKFLYLLCKDNLISNKGESVIEKLYEKNDIAQREISDKFYIEYSKLRNNLFKSLKENNKEIDEIVLFEKSQKILDRFTFICFCQDKGLLPNHIFEQVIDNGKNSLSVSNVKIWNQLKDLFESIDKGNPNAKINKFNGGLFKKDEELDNLIVTDEILEQFRILSQYDFESDLNVNILGNILERSITDIEEIKAKIKGEKYDTKKGKRKKDAIYYTPDFVTKYIVEQTIGRYLARIREKIKKQLFKNVPKVIEVKSLRRGENKRKIKLNSWVEEIPEVSEKIDKYYRQAIVQLHLEFYERYTDEISKIKILDPSCGSGAFLNASFDYLYNEMIMINEMEESLRGGGIQSLFDLDSQILQNNLYGVDINPESVEITKLSLWLKTANKNRELTTLDNNIKCGNSIIEDKEVNKYAFEWNKEFKEIMENGGFDIVIGNPPYGAALSENEKKYITSKYVKSTQYNVDTYKTFFEKGFDLLKNNGFLGYITPSAYLMLSQSENLRRYLFDNYTLLKIVEVFNVFKDAVVFPIISIYQKKRNEGEDIESILIPRSIKPTMSFTQYGTSIINHQNILKDEGYIFKYREVDEDRNILNKIKENSLPLSKYIDVKYGVKMYQEGKGIPKQTKDIVTNKPYNLNYKKDDTWRPLLKGKDISRYTDCWNDNEFVKYGEWLAEPRNIELFKGSKICIRQTAFEPIATYTEKEYINNETIYTCLLKNGSNISLKYLLGLLNSKLIRWCFRKDNYILQYKDLPAITCEYINNIPIKIDMKEKVEKQVEELLRTYQSKQDEINKFLRYLSEEYGLQQIGKKIEKFYMREYKDFIKDLKEKNVKLKEKQKYELMDLFDEIKRRILNIQGKCDQLEENMDFIVYSIYQLTDNEVKYIENQMRGVNNE